MLDISKYKVHDLTHTLGEHIAGYADEPARKLEVDGWNAKTLTIYSHAGTHMDAPLHFGVSDTTVDELHPSKLMAKAWILDVDIHDASQLIDGKDFEGQLEKVQRGDSILVRTHWAENYNQPNFKSELPRLSEAFCRWCVQKKINMLGVEPLSVANVADLKEVTEIHKILLGGGVTIIEGLMGLDQIQSPSVFLIALPLKIQNGDGAPARVVALEEK
ncbi:cyclase family protein [Reichenbachiella ulvae]|uniref:Cyclase family protein n=1 Tax=Reichenbachiella ulvae TaxID=2980104 RepID=A0ABT3CT20_9BACT|nr:cyclase family protein [Reichenbachiella ulvae]MCV9386708.1 cyclase family protein [Reichenbachiella ulvae]